MIAASPQSNQHNRTEVTAIALPLWQQELANAITEPRELLEILHLPAKWLPGALAAARLFPLRVPRSFVDRMQPGNPHDPLLRQVLPLDLELQESSEFSHDPVGDMASKIGPGTLHKYDGRALLIATGACGVHCRYCFRRHFPYGQETASTGHWRAAIDALRADPSIREAILSGGDPLTLNDRRLREFSDALRDLPHVIRLRIHSRQPVVLPSRVDTELLNWLAAIPLQKVLVLHVNHAHEISPAVIAACCSLKQAGVTLFNQSVLLKGVNDSVIALSQLSEALFAAGVIPYYLHLLDRVQGAAHFEVSENHAAALMRSLLGVLPGYLVPKLVSELPGGASKTPVPF